MSVIPLIQASNDAAPRLVIDVLCRMYFTCFATFLWYEQYQKRSLSASDQCETHIRYWVYKWRQVMLAQNTLKIDDKLFGGSISLVVDMNNMPRG
jgi:hypothetical protein